VLVGVAAFVLSSATDSSTSTTSSATSLSESSSTKAEAATASTLGSSTRNNTAATATPRRVAATPTEPKRLPNGAIVPADEVLHDSVDLLYMYDHDEASFVLINEAVNSRTNEIIGCSPSLSQAIFLSFNHSCVSG